MSDWKLVPCLVKLRAEFNALNPDRDKGADGSIGDTAHAAGGTSDHLPDEDYPALRNKDADHINEVHAIDIDSTGPWPDGLTMSAIVGHILGYCRRNNSDPLNEARLRYIIWDRHIYRAPAWEKEVYTGTSDPHTGHAHFSAEYITELESDTSTWHVEELAMPTAEEIAAATVKAWREERVPFPYGAEGDTRRLDDLLRYTPSLAAVTNAVDAKLKARFDALQDGTRQDDVDEDAIAATVLAGITPDRLAAAFTAAGFTPEALADAIPEALADRVLDRLSERLKASEPTG